MCIDTNGYIIKNNNLKNTRNGEKMIKTLKIIAAELKRANDLKERDIKNKETWGWYIPSPVQTGPEVGDNIHTGGISYSSSPTVGSATTKGRW